MAASSRYEARRSLRARSWRELSVPPDCFQPTQFACLTVAGWGFVPSQLG